jgi:hypothetical protein
MVAGTTSQAAEVSLTEMTFAISRAGAVAAGWLSAAMTAVVVRANSTLNKVFMVFSPWWFDESILFFYRYG